MAPDRSLAARGERRVVLAIWLVAAGLVAGMTPTAANAQRQPLPGGPGGQIEVRTDVRWSGRPDQTVGVGWTRPLNRAVRAGATVGAGLDRDAAASRWAGAIEGVVRFHLDPFAERRWGWYGVAGLGGRVTEGGEDGGTDGRGYILVLGGVEGPTIGGGWRAAVEAGVGDGARVGLVLRRARRGAR